MFELFKSDDESDIGSWLNERANGRRITGWGITAVHQTLIDAGGAGSAVTGSLVAWVRW